MDYAIIAAATPFAIAITPQLTPQHVTTTPLRFAFADAAIISLLRHCCRFSFRCCLPQLLFFAATDAIFFTPLLLMPPRHAADTPYAVAMLLLMLLILPLLLLLPAFAIFATSLLMLYADYFSLLFRHFFATLTPLRHY